MHRLKSFAFGFGRLRIVILAMLTLGLGGNNHADASIIIDAPAGLAPGDTFRIVFVTDATTTATSSSEAYYNTFVNNDATAEAGGGSVTYNGTPLTFSAIASTPGEDALTNIGQFGAPVYLAGGGLVAASDSASAGGLWSGSLIAAIQYDLNGNTVGPSIVWTGTQSDGSTALALGQPSSGDPQSAGDNGAYNATWMGWVHELNQLGSAAFPLYGISQPLTVAPEPPSIVLGLMAAACGAVGAYVRRRMANRRGH